VLKSSSTLDGSASFAESTPLNNRTCPEFKIHKLQTNREACKDWVAFEEIFIFIIFEKKNCKFCLGEIPYKKTQFHIVKLA